MGADDTSVDIIVACKITTLTSRQAYPSMLPLIDKTDVEYAASSNLWPPKLKKTYLVAYRLLPRAAIPVLAPEAPPPAHLQPQPKKKRNTW